MLAMVEAELWRMGPERPDMQLKLMELWLRVTVDRFSSWKAFRLSREGC
jgi:hypothetical protein